MQTDINETLEGGNIQEYCNLAIPHLQSDTFKRTLEMNQFIPEELLFEYENLDPSAKELIQAAIKVRNNAYCPYSKFQVGSAIRTSTGEIFTGCNVENGAYSPSVCAERTAICKAVSEGFREIVAVAVVAYQENSFTTPCGVCRQFLSEFTTKDTPVYVAKPAPARVLVTSIQQLLPITFVPILE